MATTGPPRFPAPHTLIAGFCVANRGDVLFILLIMCFILPSMQGSLNGMHIPFVRPDTGPLLSGFHQAKTPITVSDWMEGMEQEKKKMLLVFP